MQGGFGFGFASALLLRRGSCRRQRHRRRSQREVFVWFDDIRALLLGVLLVTAGGRLVLDGLTRLVFVFQIICRVWFRRRGLTWSPGPGLGFFVVFSRHFRLRFMYSFVLWGCLQLIFGFGLMCPFVLWCWSGFGFGFWGRAFVVWFGFMRLFVFWRWFGL
jgi:hypothetical protein